jgi:hypothetical protein
LIRTLNPLSQALRRFISTGEKELTRAHFASTTVNSVFIKETLILRSA